MGRLLIIVAVLLALANGQCFARCLAKPVENNHASMPCHSHVPGKANVSLQQHDLELVPMHSAAPPAWNFVASVEACAEMSYGIPAFVRSVIHDSPPPLDPAGTTVPLRI